MNDWFEQTSIGKRICTLARNNSLPDRWHVMRPGQCGSLDCGIGAIWLRTDSRSLSRSSHGEYDTNGWRLAHDVVRSDGCFVRIPAWIVELAAWRECRAQALTGLLSGIDPGIFLYKPYCDWLSQSILWNDEVDF